MCRFFLSVYMCLFRSISVSESSICVVTELWNVNLNYTSSWGTSPLLELQNCKIIIIFISNKKVIRFSYHIVCLFGQFQITCQYKVFFQHTGVANLQTRMFLLQWTRVTGIVNMSTEETKDPSVNSTKMDYCYFKHLIKLCIRVMIKGGKTALFCVHMSRLIWLIDKDARRIGCQLALGWLE